MKYNRQIIVVGILMLGTVAILTITIFGIMGYYRTPLFCFNEGCSSNQYWYNGSMQNLSYVTIEYRTIDSKIRDDYYTTSECSTIPNSVGCYKDVHGKITPNCTKDFSWSLLLILILPFLVVGIILSFEINRAWIFWISLIIVITTGCLVAMVLGSIGILESTRDVCLASCKNTTRMTNNGLQVNAFDVTISTNYIAEDGKLMQPNMNYYSDVCPKTVDCYYAGNATGLSYVPNLNWLWLIVALVAGTGITTVLLCCR